MKRITSLDGIRGVAILMVMINHGSITMYPPSIFRSEAFGLIGNGHLGVCIFFVISGYLITKLLLAEREKKGSISLKDFYIRRALRIFPVFYLYIIVIILLKIFFVPNLFQNYALVGFASVYLWNYVHLFNIHQILHDKGYWFFGHFWSLSLEEQFYLLWPIMLIKLSGGTLKKTVIIIILLTPVIRVATYFLMPGSRGQENMMIQTGGHSILTGCLGALIEGTSFFKEKVLKWLSYTTLIWMTAIFLFIISPLLLVHFKGMYELPLGGSLNNFGIIILLFWCVYVPSKVSAFLNTKAMVQIGVLSYSLYIWQQLFLQHQLSHIWFNKFPINIVLVFVVAFTSYYVIEKPILSLKKKFARI